MSSATTGAAGVDGLVTAGGFESTTACGRGCVTEVGTPKSANSFVKSWIVSSVKSRLLPSQIRFGLGIIMGVVQRSFGALGFDVTSSTVVADNDSFPQAVGKLADAIRKANAVSLGHAVCRSHSDGFFE